MIWHNIGLNWTQFLVYRSWLVCLGQWLCRTGKISGVEVVIVMLVVEEWRKKGGCGKNWNFWECSLVQQSVKSRKYDPWLYSVGPVGLVNECRRVAMSYAKPQLSSGSFMTRWNANSSSNSAWSRNWWNAIVKLSLSEIVDGLCEDVKLGIWLKVVSKGVNNSLGLCCKVEHTGNTWLILLGRNSVTCLLRCLSYQLLTKLPFAEVIILMNAQVHSCEMREFCKNYVVKSSDPTKRDQLKSFY
jgi:hypothetical protein